MLLLNGGQDRVREAERLLQSIPIKQASKICCEALEGLRTVLALRFCVDFLNSNCADKLSSDDKEILERISIGIQMVEAVPESVQVR